MRRPQLSIALLMGLVAFTALNFGAIQAWSHLRLRHGLGPDGRQVHNINNTFDLLGCGSLPMVDILVVVIVIGRFLPRSRRFVLGFEAFGITALVVFVVSVTLYTEEIIQPGILWVLRSLPRSLYRLNPTIRSSIFYSIAATLVIVPQVTFAIVGGMITRAQWNTKQI
jgi:hypothetical protein